jgi:hypothetical protein
MSLPPDYRKEESLWYCITHSKKAWEWNNLPTKHLMSEEKHPNHERNKEQDREDKLREMVGGVLATGLWFFLDLYFLYPENHQAAWWLGLLFIAFQLIQNSFMRLRTTVIAIAIMTLGGGVGSFFLPPKIPQETETHGWLIPANDPSPPNPCERFRPTPPNAIAIFLALTAHGLSMIRRSSKCTFVLWSHSNGTKREKSLSAQTFSMKLGISLPALNAVSFTWFSLQSPTTREVRIRAPWLSMTGKVTKCCI